MEEKYTIILILILITSTLLYVQNKRLSITHISISHSKIPKEFNNYRILHLSDYHNTRFGKNNILLLNKIQSLTPDIIVITGDLIDRRFTNTEQSLQLLNQLTNVAPVYYAVGNHEGWLKDSTAFLNNVQKTKAVLLRNNSIDITIDKPLNQLKEPNYTVLLCHRPRLFFKLTDKNFDLMLSGHAHGGQIRLPFIGGLYAPSQGFFPKYTEGIHQAKGKTLIISRGLGNSIFPFRIFNRPEIILIELENK